MATANELIAAWRGMGPAAWAESKFGWIGEDGQPVKLTPWQRAALLSWWDNRDTCSTFAVSNVKKTGKTFLNAVLLCWRFLVLPGQHFAAGNDLDQATSRSFEEIGSMIRRNSYLSQSCKVGGKEIVFTPTGSKLTALAADATGNAGANHLTSSHTEAWGIVYEGGVRCYEELTPPPGKLFGFPALRIVDSYAGWEGESETWHGVVDRGLKGERVDFEWPIYRDGGLLLFHMEGAEARERCFRGSPEEAKLYYADQEATLRANAFARMHNNTRTTNESSFISPEDWAACFDKELKPYSPTNKRRMVMALDCSTSGDFTALVGVAEGKAGVMEVVYSRIWKPQKMGMLRGGKATVDLSLPSAEIQRIHEAGDLELCLFDPFQFHQPGIELFEMGVPVQEFPQTSQRVESDTQLYNSIMARTIKHYGNKDLTEHIKAAVAVETIRGYRLAKEKVTRKIDLAVACSMALWGAHETFLVDTSATTMPNMFYGDDEGWTRTHIYQNGVLIPKENIGQHAPGVTWKTCKQRNKGCLACINELEAEGFYKREQEIWGGPHKATGPHDPGTYQPPLDNETGDNEHERIISAFAARVRRLG